MQRKKISFVILSAILGLGTLLSGCGGNEEITSTTSGNSQGQSGQFATKMKISMFNQGTFNAAAPVPPREEDIQRQMLEEEMNIDLDMMIPQAGQATTKLNTLIAGGDIPDLIF